jgi:hypothetical protein
LIAVAALGDARALQWWGYIAIAISVLVKGPVAFVLCGLTLVVASMLSADSASPSAGAALAARPSPGDRHRAAVVRIHGDSLSRSVREGVLDGNIAFVLPALEARKVVPDIARRVATLAGDAVRIATYRLNRWNPAYRFYATATFG